MRIWPQPAAKWCGGDGHCSPWLADAAQQAPCATEGENDLCGELAGPAKLRLVLVLL